MAGLYAADGSYNISVVNGSTRTGAYAADGSINVVVSDGNGIKGAIHPCGAWYVTVAVNAKTMKAPDGSLYVQASPYTKGGQRVTVVSGALP